MSLVTRLWSKAVGEDKGCVVTLSACMSSVIPVHYSVLSLSKGPDTDALVISCRCQQGSILHVGKCREEAQG